MKLIDTSLWIEFFRRQGDPEIKRRVANEITAGTAAFTCPIYFELLSGARPHEIADIHQGLSFANRLEFEPRFWLIAGGLEGALRKAGVTVPRDDLFIAVAAETIGLPVACRDKHFAMIQAGGLNRLQIDPW